MKILFVSIPNHHFFQWANQLKESDFDVYWFDITEGAGFSNKIGWIKQFNGWKLKWDFPLRHRLKKWFPIIYKCIQKVNENNVERVFNDVVKKLQPDVIHCFEMNLSGIPILSVLEKHSSIKFVYSSWGSDLYDFKSFGLTKLQVTQFLYRVDYLITDCDRDCQLAILYGFTNNFLGVFPGNGGISIPVEAIFPSESRNLILIKGYDDGVGKASVVLHALENLPKSILSSYEIIVFSADITVKPIIEQSEILSQLNLQVFPRSQHITNEEILRMMGNSVVYIGNSRSDGMPNTLLESMGMGAFPIQSNPGGATEEVLQHGVNGYLITFPENIIDIAHLIERALINFALRKTAQDYNVAFINKRYNRSTLKPRIVTLYNNLLK